MIRTLKIGQEGKKNLKRAGKTEVFNGELTNSALFGTYDLLQSHSTDTLLESGQSPVPVLFFFSPAYPEPSKKEMKRMFCSRICKHLLCCAMDVVPLPLPLPPMYTYTHACPNPFPHQPPPDTIDRAERIGG